MFSKFFRRRKPARPTSLKLEALECRVVPAMTSTFQQGDVNGYTGTLDTWLSENQGGARFDTEQAMVVRFSSSGSVAQSLIRFDSIFTADPANNPTKIQNGARILKATLTLNTEVGGDGAEIHRMVTGWAGSDTWDTFGNGIAPRNATKGIQANGAEALGAFAAQVGNSGLGDDPATGATVIEVTEDLQAWASGFSNTGWALLPWANGGSEWQISSSDNSTLANRPKLSVVWEPAHLSSTNFRQGVGSYTGVVDTMLVQDEATTNHSATVNLFVNASAPADQRQVLLRFDNIVGFGAGQVPAGSLIVGAYLDLAHVSSASAGNGGTLHRMLVNWAGTDTWNSRVNGISANNVEARTAFNTQIGTGSSSVVHSGFYSYDVTADVTAWVQDAANNPNLGWAFLPFSGGNDTLGIASSESAAFSERPRLRIVYNGPARLGVSAAVINYNENDPATIIDSSATVQDADSPDLNGGNLTIDYSANGSADDRLAIRSQGTGAGQIGLSGNDVTYEGVVIGVWSGGTGTDPLVIAFNSNATAVKAQALMRNITFRNISDDPDQLPRFVRFVLFDGDSVPSDPVFKQINVKSIAETPSATGSDTLEDIQTTTGLVITPNPLDGDSVLAFQITNLHGGTLYLADGFSEVENNTFVTTDEAGEGLRFTPFTDLNDLNTMSFGFSIQATTDGGGVGLGGDVVDVVVTVTPVNDQPFFNLPQTVVNVAEDSGLFTQGGFATAMSPRGGSDETDPPFGPQNLSFLLTPANPSLFDVQPIIDNAGQLVFTLAENANGSTLITVTLMDDGGTDNGGIDSLTRTFTLNIAPVVDTPPDINATTAEDVQTNGLVLQRGPGDGTEVTHFQISGITNGRLFQNNGTTEIFSGSFITFAQGNAGLKFTPSADLNDVTTTTFGFVFQAALGNTVADLGGNLALADIGVSARNDEPTFVLALPNVTVNEDTGLFTRTNFLTNRRPGPATATDELGQTLTLNFSNDNNALFSAQPAIGATGTLTFTPAANAFGVATVTVNLVDNGGTANGGDNTGTQTFTITISPINDPPTFSLLGDVTIDEDSGPQSISNFAFNFNPGPGEGTQTVDSYTVTVQNIVGNLTFTAAPAIDTAGTLTFTTAPNAFGTATVQVIVIDSGGESSAPQTFQLIVNNFNDPAAAADDAYTILSTFNPVALPVLANDLPLNDGPSLSIVAVSAGSAGGTITNMGDHIAYTPAPGFLGVETFTYTVSDGLSTATANVSVTVNQAVPDATLIAVGTDAGVSTLVRLYDPATRAPIREFSPFFGFTGGVHVAVGDLTGDGVADIAVATASAVGHVKVFDGVTGGEVWSFLPFGGFPSGLEVAIGDVNGDAVQDLVIGTTSFTTHVKAFAGITQGELLSFIAYEGFGGGVRLAVGNADGDADADIVIVAGPGGNGHVKVFDGTTAAVQRSYLAYVGYSGEVLLSIGRVDGDQFGDVVTTAVNPFFGIHIRATSGASGGDLASFFSPLGAPQPGLVRPPAATVPAGRISLSDLTGDGIDDFLLATGPSNQATQVQILNGLTFAIVDQIFAFGPTFTLGAFVDAG